MIYCEKVSCIFFELYEDWQLTPDGEVPETRMWCRKQHKDLSRDSVWLSLHECPLAIPTSAKVITDSLQKDKDEVIVAPNR